MKHLVAQRISHAGRHVSDDPDALAGVFCRLELIDGEGQNAVGVVADGQIYFDQLWKPGTRMQHIIRLTFGCRFRRGRSFVEKSSFEEQILTMVNQITRT